MYAMLFVQANVGGDIEISSEERERVRREHVLCHDGYRISGRDAESIVL